MIHTSGESQRCRSSQGIARSVSGIVTCSKGRRRNNWHDRDSFWLDCSDGGFCRTDGAIVLSISICEGIFGGEGVRSALLPDGRLQVAQLSHFNGLLSSLGNVSNKTGAGVTRGREIGHFR
jgi:hypothetical protein